LIVALTMSKTESTFAKMADSPLIAMKLTGYYQGVVCKDGTVPITGLTCASKDEWLGYTAIVWERLPNGAQGKLIGFYECHDTGGAEVSSGRNLDIRCDTEADCYAITQPVYVQYVFAEG